MKKKLLIVLMVVFFACLFSVFASAESYVPTFGKMTEVGGMSEKANFGKDGKFETCTSRVLMSDGVTYPSYYIYTDSAIHTVDFSELNQKTGKNYDRNTVICLEMPEGITTIPNCFAASGSQIFWGDRYTSTLEYLKFSSTVTSMSTDATIFNMTALKLVDMSVSKVETIPGRGFQKAYSLEEVRFPATLKTIGETAFQNCSSLTNLDFSNTLLEDIGLRAFFECTALETVNFGTHLKKLQTQCFYMAGANSDKEYLSVYIHSSLNEIYDQYGGTGIFQSAKVATIYYTGSNTDEAYSLIRSNPFQSGASNWASVDAKGEGFDENATYTQNTVIYNYNVCKAYYNGIHKFDTDCTTADSCQNSCGKTNTSQNAHKGIESISYPNGFIANGIYSVECTNDGCSYGSETETVLDPIFKALEENGYSTNGNGIAFGGYTVVLDSLKKFNEVNEKDVSFGIVIANPKYLGDTFMVNGEVNATSGFLKVDMTSDEYSDIKVMLDGFTGNAQNLELVISLYAITGEDVEYIQSEHTACANAKVTKSDATLYTVTLNSVANKPYKDNLDALPEFGKEENN